MQSPEGRVDLLGILQFTQLPLRHTFRENPPVCVRMLWPLFKTGDRKIEGQKDSSPSKPWQIPAGCKDWLIFRQQVWESQTAKPGRHSKADKFRSPLIESLIEQWVQSLICRMELKIPASWAACSVNFTCTQIWHKRHYEYYFISFFLPFLTEITNGKHEKHGIYIVIIIIIESRHGVHIHAPQLPISCKFSSVTNSVEDRSK